ncbi:hypothetical protein JCM10213_002357 [Rhodosporidiobolus nylandii]
MSGLSLAASLANPDFSYVLAVAAAGVPSLLMFATHKVSKARKAAKIAYPAAYADNALAERDLKAKQFNCAQRSHQNTLENLPLFLTSLLYTGLHHPKYAAAAGAIWVVGRFAYVIGYSSGEPKKRYAVAIQYIGQLPLLLFSIYKSVAVLPCFQ